MFSTSAISFVIAMIFSSMIGTSFLDKGYHLRGGIGRWGERDFDLSIAATKVANCCWSSIGGMCTHICLSFVTLTPAIIAPELTNSICLVTALLK